MAQIMLDHVDKTYAGAVKAVSDLSLEVRDGEFMVLVGLSGVREVDRPANDRRT